MYPVILITRLIAAIAYLGISAFAIFGALIFWQVCSLPRPELFAAIVAVVCFVAAIAFVVIARS